LCSIEDGPTPVNQEIATDQVLGTLGVFLHSFHEISGNGLTVSLATNLLMFAPDPP